MSARTATRIAWSMCAATLLLQAVALLLILLDWSTPLPNRWTPWQGQAISFVGLIGTPILGGLVSSRHPDNPYGWLWLGFALASTLLFFAPVYAAYALVAQPGSLPAARLVGTVVAGVGWTVAISLVPFLLLLFPTGRLPSRRWRLLAWAVVVAGATALIAGSFAPSEGSFAPVENPLAAGGNVAEAITMLVNVAGMVVLIASVPASLSLVFRYRRTRGVERQQIKWFAYAAVLLVAVIATRFACEPPGAWDALVEAVPLGGLYVAVCIAILRYKLYDIDLIINRTLVYATLSAALIYVGSVVSLQSVLGALTEQDSQLAVVASTLVIAALFNPLRRRVQGFVDRRFYRRKYDAARTLAAFSTRLREETDLDALRNDLVGVIRETMQPAHVSLWLLPDTDSQEGGVPGRQRGALSKG